MAIWHNTLYMAYLTTDELHGRIQSSHFSPCIPDIFQQTAYLVDVHADGFCILLYPSTCTLLFRVRRQLYLTIWALN